MPLNLGPRTLLYLVVDSESPETFSAFGGQIIPLTDAEVASLPVGIDVLNITLEGSPTQIPGISRTVAGRLEWLIRPLPDPVITMFNAIPGPEGWVDPAAQGVWAATGQFLLAFGVPPADLIGGFPALYNAAVANYLAQQATP